MIVMKTKPYMMEKEIDVYFYLESGDKLSSPAAGSASALVKTRSCPNFYVLKVLIQMPS